MTEPTSNHPQVAEWLGHIRTLAVEIGPRGATRPGERRGAEYARTCFEKMGLKPAWETFSSAISNFHPHVLGGVLMLVAFALFPRFERVGPILAALLSLLVVVSELQELGAYNNLFRLVIPRGQSQNVFGVIPPSGEHTRDLVLIGHVDSQRTPLIFRSRGWVKAYNIFIMLAFVTFILQTVLFSLAAIFVWKWALYACIPTAICALLLAIIMAQADFTPFTAGANDNASAVGMVLTLAKQFAQQPLEHTRVYAVVSGCEEVQHYGAIDFYRRHRAEMKEPQALVFEMIGCAGPAWELQEGIIVPFKGDARLVAACERLAAAHPEWQAYPTNISGGNSELADGLRAKVPGICLFGIRQNGEAPYWHQPSDTFDKMDPDVMERTWAFTRALITEIDQ